MFKSNKGFTLVEVMIVILIVAMLAAISIPNILRVRVEAHDAAAQSALKAISTALENYAATNNIYPTQTTSLTSAIPPAPPYLNADFFTGIHNGFQFTSALTEQTYSVTATPASANLGTASFTITTGGVLTQN